jgi:hypothetical protein
LSRLPLLVEAVTQTLGELDRSVLSVGCERLRPVDSALFCADTFHAIRSDRPYRRGVNARSALDEIRRAGGSQLDSDTVDALLRAARRLDAVVQSAASGLTATLRSRRLVELLV